MKPLKIQVMVLLFLLTMNAHALPIMNRNTPGAENLNFFPDSRDPNLLYYAPNLMILGSSKDSTPLFMYNEFKERFTQKALIQAVMVPGFHENDLASAKARIRALHPAVQFAALPFVGSKIEISDQFAPLIESGDCNHLAGNVSDEQTCLLTLTPKGRRVILRSLLSSSGISMNFNYQIEGVLEDADGKYSSKTFNFSVAGHIGGSEMRNFPNLFLDHKGNPVELWFD